MIRIDIQFSRFSAFYSPLIAAIAGGFLEEEGLKPTHTVAAPGVSAIAALRDGAAHVVQSAPSQGFTALEKGLRPEAVHFAQINEMDGFFLAARRPDPDFSWPKLAGRRVLVDHGGQPLAMFKFACHRMGLDYATVEAVDAGDSEAMDRAFRAGEGEYIHQQGPAPQRLEDDGVGHVVAAVGAAIGPCAFSSLAALPPWLETDMAHAFMRGYRKARAYVNEAAAEDVARLERPFFPGVEAHVLAATIATYQNLGCWTPHVEITRPAYEAALEVFLHAGGITRRHAYADVVAAPPAG